MTPEQKEHFMDWGAELITVFMKTARDQSMTDERIEEKAKLCCEQIASSLAPQDGQQLAKLVLEQMPAPEDIPPELEFLKSEEFQEGLRRRADGDWSA